MAVDLVEVKTCISQFFRGAEHEPKDDMVSAFGEEMVEITALPLD